MLFFVHRGHFVLVGDAVCYDWSFVFHVYDVWRLYVKRWSELRLDYDSTALRSYDNLRWKTEMFVFIIAVVEWRIVVGVLDLRSAGCKFDSRPPRFRVQPWASRPHTHACVTKQCNLGCVIRVIGKLLASRLRSSGHAYHVVGKRLFQKRWPAY